MEIQIRPSLLGPIPSLSGRYTFVIGTSLRYLHMENEELKRSYVECSKYG